MSKVFWKYIFCGISINSFRKQTYFYEKSCCAYNRSAELDKFYAIYLVLTTEMIFVAGTTKINLKNLKTYLCLDNLMQATI